MNKLDTREKELIKAVRDKNLEKAKELIRSGVNPNFEINNAITPSILHIAALKNDLNMVKWLVEDGGVLVTREMISLISLYRNFNIMNYFFTEYSHYYT